jgi:hypothetical protein
MASWFRYALFCQMKFEIAVASFLASILVSPILSVKQRTSKYPGKLGALSPVLSLELPTESLYGLFGHKGFRLNIMSFRTYDSVNLAGMFI